MNAIVARTPMEAVWCPAPQPQPALVIYNRLPKCGSSTVLNLLQRASHLSGFSFKHGDVMHENLNMHEQNKLVVGLMNASATHAVLFEQHIPYLSFSAVAAFAAFGERAEPPFIQLVREPTARVVSGHYFVRACFCNTRGGTRPPAPGQFWCAPGTALYKQYDQQAMCSGDINAYYALRNRNRTHRVPGVPDSNVMVRYFCGHADICQNAEPIARKAASLLAWEHLSTKYTWVGVLEKWNESFRLLHAALPSYMPAHVLQIAMTPTKEIARNVAKETNDSAPPGEATLAAIRAEVALDLWLYQRVLGLHQNRVRVCL
mmetsp:Transcript_14543/g.29450  ORF Transcript_14543/g.29450 Transcript_14543/m.29450 type:complete len:317 (+) Transcript_14543:123-1073(+)|eukprot:CAMPEP_0119076654 /NCGR_PEP_ID=MMETSP1178-20130426/88810_1 /TAXON_ID=33656 /ORGANISM="unid sp, Strain CCMP2000" /LENGTH=316 /DNA_ID=CAMNT_0007058957 /DNA_START=123 /DNA_END=1073 /DNA_ORIENTATION=-